MGKTHKFDCGCEIPILDEAINPQTGLPSLDIDFDKLPLDCPTAWKAFQEGNTSGVFQLESHLGVHWSKQIKPEEVEDVSAIISVIRPGVLDTKLDNKSMTQVFADRKNGNAVVKVIDESIKDILDNTQQVIVYQEQIMAIAKRIAGFDLVQVDKLRKSVGKKNVAELNKSGEEFITGCEKTGIVSKEKAIEIWDAIKASGRYSFNKSHGVSYALLGYWTIWIKTHYPLHFYTSWLTHAKHKMKPKEEIRKLVRDAKYNDITVRAPDISLKPIPAEFTIFNKNVFFGIRDIKKIGDSQLKKLVTKLEEAEKKLAKPINTWTFYEFLTNLSDSLGKSIVHGLISVGAIDFFGLSRRYMLFEYNTYDELTDRERAIISSPAITSLTEALQLLKNEVNTRRLETIDGLLKTLKDPPSALEDTQIWVNKTEQDMLGIPLSVYKNEIADYLSDTTCREYNEGKKGTMILSVCVSNVKETTIKNGQSKGEKMAFIDIEDDTGELSAVCFASQWAEFSSILYRGNTVILTGSRSKKDSFTINKVRQI